jgi:DNA-binding CsgD family transcriptional regulator
MTLRQRPTRRQLEVLRAYIRAGSIAAAAHELGISETTARQHLSGLYRRTGCLTVAQAAYWLGRHAGRRTEVHGPATTDLPVTMRLAEPPEPLDWLQRA